MPKATLVRLTRVAVGGRNSPNFRLEVGGRRSRLRSNKYARFNALRMRAQLPGIHRGCRPKKAQVTTFFDRRFGSHRSVAAVSDKYARFNALRMRAQLPGIHRGCRPKKAQVTTFFDRRFGSHRSVAAVSDSRLRTKVCQGRPLH